MALSYCDICNTKTQKQNPRRKRQTLQRASVQPGAPSGFRDQRVSVQLYAQSGLREQRDGLQLYAPSGFRERI